MNPSILVRSPTISRWYCGCNQGNLEPCTRRPLGHNRATSDPKCDSSSDYHTYEPWTIHGPFCCAGIRHEAPQAFPSCVLSRSAHPAAFMSTSCLLRFCSRGVSATQRRARRGDLSRAQPPDAPPPAPAPEGSPPRGAARDAAAGAEPAGARRAGALLRGAKGDQTASSEMTAPKCDWFYSRTRAIRPSVAPTASLSNVNTPQY